MIQLTDIQKNTLHGNREEKYILQLTDSNGLWKRDLKMEKGTISVNANSAVKRQASFAFINDGEPIDIGKERLQPIMAVKMPGGTYTKWKKGRYMITAPNESEKNNVEYYEVECMDESTRLQQDKFTEAVVFPAGTTYVGVLNGILISSGFGHSIIGVSSAQLPVDLVLDDSKSKLEWFNELCEQINFSQLYINDAGIPTAMPYMVPDATAVSYTYERGRYSVLFPGKSKKMDYWNIPNVIKRVVSRPDMPPLVSINKNEDPTSILSIPSRGMSIVDSQTVNMIETQEELDALTDRIAYEVRRIEQEIQISTLNMPHHEVADVIELVWGNTTGVYQETAWSMELAPGAQMKHTLKRTVI